MKTLQNLNDKELHFIEAGLADLISNRFKRIKRTCINATGMTVDQRIDNLKSDLKYLEELHTFQMYVYNMPDT